MAISKKRIIKSLENLSEELRELLKDQYPNGYENSITRISNAKKESIFVFPLETEDATYLIKVPAVKNSDGEYDVEKKEEDEFGDDGGAGGDSDDDYGSDEPDSYRGGSDGEDDYEGGGKKSGREASYDPDFD
jgi:hypothetical protein